MLPDFNRLRVFYYVHRNASVTAAAKELSVTQSAVSQNLAKLEAEVGAQLFVRRHRALVPTPAAHTLFAALAPFVEAIGTGLDEIHRTRTEISGVLSVGAPVEFGAQRLVEALSAFRELHPNAAFDVRLGHPQELVPALHEGELDVAFIDIFETGNRALAGLDLIPVVDEGMALIGARRYESQALGGRRGFRDLSGATFVAYQPSAPALRGWFRHHFGKVPARLEIGLSVESVQAVVASVELGMGFGLVPMHAVRKQLDRGRLVAITTRRKPVNNQIGLARRLDRVPLRLERAFVQFVQARSWD